MRFLFNLTSLRYAGGKRVGLGILNALNELLKNADNDYTFIVLTPNGTAYKKNCNNLICEELPEFLYKSYNFLRKEKWVKEHIKKYKPDALFELGNIALPVSDIPQLLLIQWPYVAYPESKVWDLMSYPSFFNRKFKKWLLRRRIKYADRITVQSKTMEGRIKKYINPGAPIHVIPSPVDQINNKSDTVTIAQNNAWKRKVEDYSESYKQILYLTRYYSHKNVEILLDAAKYAKENGIAIQFLTTIDPGHDEAAQDFISQIDRLNLEPYLINLGEIPQDEVYFLMSEVDGLVMPTLLETYGLPYFEAMGSGIPIFASDLDFSHSACGDAGWYFDPHDGKNIVTTINQAFSEPQKLKDKIQKGKKRVENLPVWQEAVTDYIKVMENMNKES